MLCTNDDRHRGNNAVTFKDVYTNTTPQSSPVLNFDYFQDPTQDPTVPINVNAARTNAFVTVNTMHDISYLYGFTESTFNFQSDNNGAGGVGGDRAQVFVQNAGTFNNGQSALG